MTEMIVRRIIVLLELELLMYLFLVLISLFVLMIGVFLLLGVLILSLIVMIIMLVQTIIVMITLDVLIHQLNVPPSHVKKADVTLLVDVFTGIKFVMIMIHAPRIPVCPHGQTKMVASLIPLT
jgi:hypothetical protein